MLPAPLSVGLPTPRKLGRESSPVSEVSRSHNHLADDEYYGGDSGSNHRLIPSSGDYPASSPDEMEPSRQSGSNEQERYRAAASKQPSMQSAASAAMMQQGVRHGMVANSYPGETANPYRHSLPQVPQVAQTAAVYSDQGHDTTTDEEEFPRRRGASKAIVSPSSSSSAAAAAALAASRAARGVSLVDHGPVVPAGGGERRVPRPSARRQSVKPSGGGGSGAQQATSPSQSQQGHQSSGSADGHQQQNRSASRQPIPAPPPGASFAQAPRWNDPRYQ